MRPGGIWFAGLVGLVFGFALSFALRLLDVPFGVICVACALLGFGIAQLNAVHVRRPETRHERAAWERWDDE